MLTCSGAIVSQTLSCLQAGGADNCETVVLWLGRRSKGDQVVVEVFRPQQNVDVDLFHIPPEGMRSLLAHLRDRRLQILAQVHSHPRLAFHSKADDEWAIVRHLGAISIVIPWFAARTTTSSLLRDAAAFELDDNNEWKQVPAGTVVKVQN